MAPVFAIFGIGSWELLALMAVLLLLFGHRLPSAMRSLGQGITEFKKGLRDDKAPEEAPKITQDP